MNKLIIILITSSFILLSCNNNNSNEQDTSSKVTIEQINNLEGELFGGDMTTPNLEKAKELVGLYIEYANTYPKDTVSADLLFKAADISMNLSSAKNTIALFNRILNEYPDYRNVSTVLFLKGFVYEDQVRDYEKAGKCYIDFLEKYPESDFADDAKVSIQNLGKSPEDLIREFESKNK